MDAQYHQFGSAERGSVQAEPKITTPTVFTDRRKIVFYILYGILVLLLLILLMVTGIKLSQINKAVSNIKHHIEKLSHGETSSSSSAVQPFYIAAVVPVAGTCENGWVSFQRSCYLLSSTSATWSQAEELCRNRGGHLLVLNNVEELDYISAIVPISFNYWIGLVERHNEGHWSWVDGTDFNSSQTFWDIGQPDDWDYRENGEDCGQIHASRDHVRKLWNDADCSLKYRYICESKA